MFINHLKIINSSSFFRYIATKLSKRNALENNQRSYNTKQKENTLVCRCSPLHGIYVLSIKISNTDWKLIRTENILY